MIIHVSHFKDYYCKYTIMLRMSKVQNTCIVPRKPSKSLANLLLVFYPGPYYRSAL